MTMNRSKILLFFLIFTLLFFQQQLQQEANAQNLPIADNFSINQAPQNSGKLNGLGQSLGDYCYQGDPASTHCVEVGTYPPLDPSITYAKSGYINPLRVDVENYYLYNVLPREMDVATYDPPLAALKAQALASRSIAEWKADKRHNQFDEFKSVDNSTDFQVFVPGSFDHYNPAAKGKIQQAVDETSGQYLFFPNTQGFLSIDAEFSNDIGNPTISGGWTDYLKSVQEPISINPPCDLDPVGNGWGMSQKGAMRWAKGNQCAGNGNQPWPVTWTDYRQILVHYYTGIDILNGSGGKVAPDDRWNLISHTLPLDASRVATVNAGETLTFNVKLQNTSAANSIWSDVVMGYKWNDGNWTVLPNSASSTPLGNPLAELSLSILVPTDLPANSTLHLDLGHQIDSQTVHWFSEQPLSWPDAQIEVQVDGTVTSTPTFWLVTQTPTLTPTPQTCYPIPGADAYADCVVDFKANGSNNSWILPEKVLGPPPSDCHNWNFLSLGGGDGYVIVDMGPGEELLDVLGMDDLKIYETGSGCGGDNEPYSVEVSGSPTGPWTSLGNGNGTSTFDLGEHGVANARYVKITDGNPNVNNSSHTPGADIEAIEALHSFATATPLPSPTPCTLNCRWPNGNCVFFQDATGQKLASLSKEFISAVKNFDRVADQAVLLYRVRDEILSTTPEGQRLIDL